MRKWCVAAALALASSSAFAADFGIGVSVRSDDGYLYAPIDLSKSFRLEPSIRYGSSELSFGDIDSRDKQESEIWEVGIGVFGLRQVTEAAHIYYGGRLAYLNFESSNSQSSGSLGLPLRGESEQDGYSIGPTLGFEYLFGGRFSVGGEASYIFLDTDGESTGRIGNFSSSVSKTEQKTQTTQTRLIFRYMF